MINSVSDIHTFCQHAIMSVCRMVRVCCLAADASGGVSDVTKELIEIGLDIKHKHKVCVCDESGRDERFTLTHFGTVTKYALACV